MFVFKAKTFLEELKLHNPQMAELSIASFENAQVESDFIRLNAESFGQIKGDSIDYALMEKTTKGKIVKSIPNPINISTFSPHSLNST